MCDDNNKRLPNATNGFISNSCRQMPNTTTYNGTAAVTSEGSMKIINQQCQEIYELRTQLNSVMSERDALLNEVGRLKFNMEFYDQRAARESKYDDSNNRRFFNRCQKYNHWADTVSKNSIGQPEPLHTSASYELSQDLIEMRIEIIEQKYGGSCASAAAIIIQRAFRHYMLLKKFAHITAIAKAEKILTKQLENTQSVRSHNNQTNQKSGTKPGCKTVRCNSLPRSKSGRCDLNYYYTLESCSHYCLHSCNYNDLKVNVNTMNMEIISEPFFCQEDINQVNNHNNMIPNFLSDNHSNDSDTYKQAHSGSDCNQYISSDGIFSTEGYVSNTTNTKIPPEVPKRTSSISFRSLREHQRNIASGALNQISNSDSLTSVQSSSSDCSISHSQNMNQTNSSVDSSILSNSIVSWSINSQVSDVIRKRQYRIGLNLFNKNPSKGIIYLVCRGFLDNTPHAVARFLISRKGISKKMIGEYLSDLQNSFNSAVLEYFAQEIDLSGMQVDMALRKFQTYFRMPGEAQKIEKIIEVFSHRYCLCNRDVVARLRNLDTVFILAFAIIMLNTDLHTPNMKPEQRMKLDDFIKNLRGVDNCEDIDRIMLVGIYERIKANEFKPGSDHVTQVLKVQSTIVGKKPNLALPHRRLVCYCRLYEVIDIYKKERPGVHQREVFLFNDLLVITKILCKKKNSVTYMFRQSYLLNGLTVSLFQMPHYQFGIKLIQRLDGNLLITFNARNDHDRCKFVEDIRESISEMDEMENLRIESEIQRYRHSHNNRSINSNSENRDSGVSDIDLGPLPMGSPKEQDSFRGNQATIKRPALTVT